MSETLYTTPNVEPVTPTKVERLPDAEVIKNSVFATPVNITRNGITAVLQTFVGKRKQWDGVPYAAFQLTANETLTLTQDQTFLDGVTFIGRSNVANAINAFFRRFGQDAVTDNTAQNESELASIGDGAEVGKLFLPGLVRDWTDMAASGMKIAEVLELLEAEQKAYQDFVSNVVMVQLPDPNVTDEQKVAISKEGKERVAKINDLRAQFEARKKKKSGEEQTNTVRPA